MLHLQYESYTRIIRVKFFYFVMSEHLNIPLFFSQAEKKIKNSQLTSIPWNFLKRKWVWICWFFIDKNFWKFKRRHSLMYVLVCINRYGHSVSCSYVWIHLKNLWHLPVFDHFPFLRSSLTMTYFFDFVTSTPTKPSYTLMLTFFPWVDINSIYRIAPW